MKKIAFSIGAMLLFAATPSFADTVDVAANFTEMIDVARVFAVFIGFLLFANALYGFYTWSKTGGSQGSTPGKSVTKLIIGSMLVITPWVYEFFKASLGVETNSTSVSGDSTRMILAIDANLGSDVAAAAGKGFLAFMPSGTLKAIIAFVMFIGFVAFVSGIYTLKDAHDPHGGGKAPFLAPALKILGGIVCMNLMWFSCFVSALIGISMLCIK